MLEWKDIANKTRNLLATKNFPEARQEIQMGLEKLPNQINLLMIANDIYRASGDRDRSLEYAELLITHHPDKWQGYICAAQDLFALKRFEEGQKRIQAGLEKLPNQINLINLEKSLEEAMNIPEKATHLSVINQNGSREHYYHFLIGVLLPLINWKITAHGKIDGPVLMRSCAILDKHLISLDIPKLAIKKKIDFQLSEHFCSNVESICGYDFPEKYDSNKIRLASNYLIARADKLNHKYFKKARESSLPRVLMINRSKPNEFYNSPESEKKTTGNQRRSIPNFQEMCDGIQKYYPEIIELEDLDLYSQIALFNCADIVIAQHGAALANIVFCKQNTIILEIAYGKHREHFSNLASSLNLKYVHLNQGGDHSPVEIEAFNCAFSKVIGTFV